MEKMTSAPAQRPTERVFCKLSPRERGDRKEFCHLRPLQHRKVRTPLLSLHTFAPHKSCDYSMCVQMIIVFNCVDFVSQGTPAIPL